MLDDKLAQFWNQFLMYFIPFDSYVLQPELCDKVRVWFLRYNGVGIIHLSLARIHFHSSHSILRKFSTCRPSSTDGMMD